MRFLLVSALLLAMVRPATAADFPLGLFHGHTDIGAPAHAGTAVHDDATGDYLIGGGGANMWFKSDSFHYVWQEVSGDRAIEADIAFPQAGGNNHRKGVLMFRQSLKVDSAYADAAVHGDGLTSLQFREAAGEVTHEVQSLAHSPRRVRLEKIGDYVFLSLFSEKGRIQPTGCSARVAFKAPFYVGIGVCAHDDKAFETVRFSQVIIGPPAPAAALVRNSVEYVKVPSGDRVCVSAGDESIRVLSWDADGLLKFAGEKSHEERRFTVTAAMPNPAQPDQAAMLRSRATGESPDGKWKAVFEHKGGDAVLTLHPTAGGETRLLMRLPDQQDALTTIAWSSDSTKIAYVRVLPR